jgi:hypothetical protein
MSQISRGDRIIIHTMNSLCLMALGYWVTTFVLTGSWVALVMFLSLGFVIGKRIERHD